MLLAITGAEEIIRQSGVVLGIIGMPRSAFDTMLRPLPSAVEGKSKASMLVDKRHLLLLSPKNT